MLNKRQIMIELDGLFQKVVKEENCQFKELLHENITPAQFMLLKLICHKAECKAADIAQILEVSPAAATNMLERLYKNGWIERGRSEKDRRVVWLKLTPSGKELLTDVEARRIDLMLERFKNVTEEEMVFIKKIFLNVLNNMKPD
ncbi:MarR family transcriptional regulator [Desulforamulus ruminis]|uniref:Regulatory protein MarR n=1 Tax=Desulforamulus ruminis (strain ATCC 23193 / DSM 2154 / NCIMB 8452 / DL) TaxID=696281 RepID=F6DR47_DESRL|nr:MarR family transcriptional regulator [Desulforamulus ruminis]AEG59766.1 regulatory protein MarR [Desulforamulus ruminis DSM 2154]